MTLVAPSDGSTLCIGYAGETVLSPNQDHSTVWTYDGEEPHSDSLNRVALDGLVIPGRYWGRGHAWSPGSDYFTLERYLDRSALYVVRVADRTWIKVAYHSQADSLDYPVLTLRRYGEKAPTRVTFTEHQEWSSFERFPYSATFFSGT